MMKVKLDIGSTIPPNPEEDMFSSFFIAFSVVFPMIISLITFGNLIALIAVIKYEELQRERMFFILNWADVDLCSGIFVWLQ